MPRCATSTPHTMRHAQSHVYKSDIALHNAPSRTNRTESIIPSIHTLAYTYNPTLDNFATRPQGPLRPMQMEMISFSSHRTHYCIWRPFGSGAASSRRTQHAPTRNARSTHPVRATRWHLERGRHLPIISERSTSRPFTLAAHAPPDHVA